MATGRAAGNPFKPPSSRMCFARRERLPLPPSAMQTGQKGYTFPSYATQLKRYIACQKLCNKFPWGGKEVRLHFCLLKMSNLPLALPFAITRAHLYFLSFLSFFSQFIIFVIIREYFISNTARRPIDMVVQTNPNSIHNQENFVPSFDTIVLLLLFKFKIIRETLLQWPQQLIGSSQICLST